MSETAERRRHPRTEVELSASLERLGLRPAQARATTLDLSEGGARVRTDAAFAVGDVVRLVIASADLAVENQGLVVAQRADGDGTVLNVAFKKLGDQQTRQLRRLIDPAAGGA